ncbi:hypothetical protein B0H17DRAFT_1033205 [Mycena rosella]|uniref:PIN domain-like protein n=1 Tax=Mycena rosella TaxID=1033263 RepID=A0AAD7GXZ9_MYCRO|nr:hypothetical protein B0H17DRAFT_1033205 [Mycena rosella]
MGVKSLWKLLSPVGRPVMLETMEGQVMAIDSSIWIYQFQATMRDNDGRALSNAHVLGFLRRIAKLLFYGIKPVFVFDGGAPALKRNTLNERKRKKAGAAISHAKLAEKLLAAQLRREALNHTKGAQKPVKGKGKAPSGPVVLDDNTVYLEDIDSSIPRTPARKANAEPSSVSPSKAKFHDHDPYHLPDIDLEAAVASATRAAVPDPRLATEDELREFIEDMRPEDFDVTSPAFRELPTEVQYEIVGDLRLKSRQTSYARLQNMLKSAPTPLDFSKQQIQNLRQRNTLTQQLLMTTDSMGKTNITIPVRVASERNREYLLIKNEGHEGGWILGIRDDGTRDKPIEIDKDSDKGDDDIVEGDSDEDMEEVLIPQPGVPDADLQEYQRSMNLAAIANRQAPKRSAPNPPNTVSRPLFDLDDGNDLVPIIDDDDDGELAFAIQQSLDQANAGHRPRRPAMDNAVASSSKLVDTTPRRASDPVFQYPLHDEDVFLHGNRLETALSIANAGPVRTPTRPAAKPSSSLFGESVLLQATPPAPPRAAPSPLARPAFQLGPVIEAKTGMEAVPAEPIFGKPILLKPKTPASSDAVPAEPMFGKPILLKPKTPPPPATSPPRPAPQIQEMQADKGTETASGQPIFGKPLLLQPKTPPTTTMPSPRSAPQMQADPGDLSDEEMEEILSVFSAPETSRAVPLTAIASSGTNTEQERISIDREPATAVATVSSSAATVVEVSLYNDTPSFFTRPSPESTPFSDSYTLVGRTSVEPPATSPVKARDDPHDDEPITRAPSPVAEDWDPAQEMDADAEEGGFAQFMSHVKGKDLDEVRREIDDEIRCTLRRIGSPSLSREQMMLSLFGIPYITAPMEAEAQCAELVHLGLVNGVITDDSDVFLFGSQRVFKNMFNQSKTVECFLLSDLSRELGLDRDTLIRLAYLLGSDYVDGLPGIGPVVAMELLGEFPGQDGLHKFKHWWTKVQSGKDRPEDNKSKFRKRFVGVAGSFNVSAFMVSRQKKKFKDLYLPSEWPNATVRDAYYHPTVDESDEPFKWGLPDLDGLREFLYVELSWSPEKVDELLLPVIQKIRKRGQTGALNKQGDLNGFFDVTGSGSAVPRKRQAYDSKRLQQVVSEFRKKRKHGSKSPAAGAQSENSQSEDDIPVKKKTKTGKAKTVSVAKRGTARGRGRGAKKSTSRKKVISDDEAEFQSAEVNTVPESGSAGRLRPRPKPAYKGALVEDVEFVDDGT